MKDKAKNAFKHKVEVAGKTIPTMIIIGLFLVGGGSAALLSTYGTVSGTANVNQAITLGDDSDFQFTGDRNDVGETSVTTRTVNSNADVATSYQFVTSGTELGVDARVYRPKSVSHNLVYNNEVGDGESWPEDGKPTPSVEKSYDSSENEVVLTLTPTELSSQDQEINKGFILDTDRDGMTDFQVVHYDGSWKYVPHENNQKVKSEKKTDSGDFPSWLDVSSSEDSADYSVSVDAEVTGGTFRYAVQSMEDGTGVEATYPERPEFDWFDSSGFPTAQIGPQVGTGAANDLEEGTVTRTYQNGAVTFNFSEPGASPVLGIDTRSDGNWDLQFDYNGAGLDLWNEGSDGDWSHYGEYKDPDEHSLDGNPHWEDSNGDDVDAPEGVSISGGKHTDFVEITIDTSRLGDTFRYDVGQNGDVFSGKDVGDSSQAEVVTTGVETLDAGASQDYTLVHDFAINLDPSETYDLTTKVVPVTE